MKKLDLFIIKAFSKALIMTTSVATFILLLVFLLRYFDDFVGKNLGVDVFMSIIFYFSLNQLQISLPLGILIASLLTFGTLGEYSELTAIKSAGISLLQIIRPLFVFVIIISIGSFYFNNYIVPSTNLKAYSLLYDIKHAKPALDIKAGIFYKDIPNFSILAREKLPDEKTLKDVLIYDHSQGIGNKTVIIADSSIMYTTLEDRYLKLELYRGNYYSENAVRKNSVDQLYRTSFEKMDLMFSLSSFELKRRKEELFRNNRQMKNIDELSYDIDSFAIILQRTPDKLLVQTTSFFKYLFQNKDSIKSIIKDSQKLNIKPPQVNVSTSSFNPFKIGRNQKNKKIKADDHIDSQQLNGVTNKQDIEIEEKVSKNRWRIDTLDIDTLSWVSLEEAITNKKTLQKTIYNQALNKARSIQSSISRSSKKTYDFKKKHNQYVLEKLKKYSNALSCIIMFLIGAPLGAIIKKGGLGIPTLVSVFFFIIYYIFSTTGDKYAKEDVMSPYLSVWLANMVLLPFGIYFLRQARYDARLFENDIYIKWIERVRLLVMHKTKIGVLLRLKKSVNKK